MDIAELTPEPMGRAMMRWIISAMQPILATENGMIVKMVKILHPKVTVSRKNMARRRILDYQKSLRTKMTNCFFLSGGNIWLTAGSWASTAYKCYMTITAHWIDSAWCL